MKINQETLKKHALVEDVKVIRESDDKTKIEVYTNEVRLASSKGKNYNLGKILITIHLFNRDNRPGRNNFYVKFSSLYVGPHHSGISYAVHPHCDEGGNPCFGGYGPSIDSALRVGNINDAVFIILEWIKKYNYGNHMSTLTHITDTKRSLWNREPYRKYSL